MLVRKDDYIAEEDDKQATSQLLVPPKPLLKRVYESIDIIDTVREKRIEESEKTYVLLCIAGVVPGVGSNFSESIENLFLESFSFDNSVQNLIKHIKIHGTNAYSNKLKKIISLKNLALIAKDMDGSVLVSADDIKAVNMFHNEALVMNFERKFTKTLKYFSDELMVNN